MSLVVAASVSVSVLSWHGVVELWPILLTQKVGTCMQESNDTIKKDDINTSKKQLCAPDEQ